MLRLLVWVAVCALMVVTASCRPAGSESASQPGDTLPVDATATTLQAAIPDNASPTTTLPGAKSDDKTETAKTDAAEDKAPAAPELTAEQAEKVNHFLGFQAGNLVKRNLEGLDVPFNEELVMQAFRDATAGKEDPYDDKDEEATKDLYKMLNERQGALQAKKQHDLEQKNRSEGEKFVAEFKKKEGVTALPSGILTRVITDGQGISPTLADQVVVRYVGKLTDGKEFDSNIAAPEPTTFRLGGLIKGWQEVLPMMKIGSKWEVVIPPDAAYGKGGGPGGPGSTLIFEIELVDVKKAEQPKAETPEPEASKPATEPAKSAETPDRP